VAGSGANVEGANGSGARWFLLAVAPDEGRPRLEREDERHAARVLRLAPGDEIVGADLRGGLWPLRIVQVGRDEVTLESVGPVQRVPRPGEPGAPLPSLEIAVCAPKGARAEEMLDRLVQLGVDRITWLVSERSQGFDRERVEGRLERWSRIAREACKQARRPWMPDLRGPDDAAELLKREKAALDIVLSPRARLGLSTVLRGSRGPIRLLVGPEGGWTERESSELRTLGALEASLAPHVLRVETAAEAAAAVAVDTLWRQ
jgi:16S rRNA (uracil1498-N3)-methyltransferase